MKKTAMDVVLGELGGLADAGVESRLRALVAAKQPKQEPLEEPKDEDDSELLRALESYAKE